MRARTLVRCYPRSWRERYGEEIEALLGEDLGFARVPVGDALSLVAGAAREWVRIVTGRGRVGTGAPAGTLGAVAAWSLVLAGGGLFAKVSEHFSNALTGPARATPQLAYDLVVAGGVVGATLLVAVAATVLAPVWRSWRAGRLGELAGASRFALALVALSAGLVGALVAIAHRSQHVLGGARVDLAARIVAPATVASLLASTVALSLLTVAALARVEVGAGVRRLLGLLGGLLALAALLVVGAVAWWWWAMDQAAPRAVSLHGSPLTLAPPLLVAVVLLGLGALGASAGALARRGA